MLSCFLPNNGSRFSIDTASMIDFDDGMVLDWGSLTYGAFLQAMRRRVSAPLPAQMGFWPFLCFWGYEYLGVGNPQIDAPNAVFPFAARWNRLATRRLRFMILSL